MTLNPFRLYRRWRRLEREARAELACAQRRHGPEARRVLQAKLSDPILTRWGRKVIHRALKLS